MSINHWKCGLSCNSCKTSKYVNPWQDRTHTVRSQIRNIGWKFLTHVFLLIRKQLADSSDTRQRQTILITTLVRQQQNKKRLKIKKINLSHCAVMGIMPLEPTPTGMWSKRHWASCSFMGWISFSWRFVRSRRTPQLISNPTPPGETTALGLLISKAARLPKNETHSLSWTLCINLAGTSSSTNHILLN